LGVDGSWAWAQKGVRAKTKVSTFNARMVTLRIYVSEGPNLSRLTCAH
jgi:hypothetical protein